MVEAGEAAGLINLLENYDCSSIVDGETNVYGESLLYIASHCGHANVVEILLDHGVKKGRGWGGVPPGLCLPN